MQLKLKAAKFVDKVSEKISNKLKLPATTLYRKDIAEKFSYSTPKFFTNAGRVLIIDAESYLITISAGSKYNISHKDRIIFGAVVYINNKHLHLKPNENGTKLNIAYSFFGNTRIDINFNSKLEPKISEIIDFTNKIEHINTQKKIDEKHKEYKNVWFSEKEYSNFKFRPISNLYIIHCKFFIDHKGIGTINMPNIKVRFSGLISAINIDYKVDEIEAYFDLKNKKIFDIADIDITNTFDNPMVIFKALKGK